MQRTGRLDYKEIASARMSARIKQFGVLVLSVIVGILISISVNS